MLSKNTIKRVKSLQQKKFRDELGLFLAEGTKLVDELIGSNFEIEEIYHTEQYLVTNVNCLVHKV
ncbi:MAG TPA: RNA methyltransferase, partial [Tenuifilum sp.]|nr:RNA methyltransferase [Tenuifilum sp.]